MNSTVTKPDFSSEPTTSDIAHDAFWNRVRARLRLTVGEGKYSSWIKPLECTGFEAGEVQLRAPSRFVKEWVLTHFADQILRQCQQESAEAVVLDIRVGNAAAVATVVAQEVQPAEANTGWETANDQLALGEMNQNLDGRFTFDSFVVGPSNQLAHAAAKNIAESPNVIPGCNPLFIYGGVGLGKTHLMQAIAHRMKEVSPQRRVIYLSAEKFMYQFIRALKAKDVVSFKEIFRSVDVLMIDDVQFICGKTSTQEEFFHTFNALVDAGKQLILSGDRSPSDLEGMEERIRSRLGWGLVADVNATTFELRLGILQSKVENLGLNISDDVLSFLAQKISSNVRELEGALNKVIAHSQLMNKPVTVESTRMILRDLLRSHEKILSVEDIKQKVADHFSIRLSDMTSERRSRAIARPRQIAMFLAKRLTPLSLPEIGRKFGGKDHTTVLHAVKRVEELMGSDAECAEDVRLLLEQLG